ncbi:hypothetical protein C0J52_21648 [Blattella germanica]|nr:hypothetical protein C0J52_21648 [Blattella germanica]
MLLFSYGTRVPCCDVRSCFIWHKKSTIFQYPAQNCGLAMASGVTRVVQRCEEAQESGNLDLNLSHNQMSKLPEELADLAELERLDISHNAYIALPHAVYKMPKLTHLNAQSNHIVDVEVERLQEAPSLQEVDLKDNPVNPRCHDALQTITRLRIHLTPRQLEDWEDLTV